MKLKAVTAFTRSAHRPGNDFTKNVINWSTASVVEDTYTVYWGWSDILSCRVSWAAKHFICLIWPKHASCISINNNSVNIFKILVLFQSSGVSTYGEAKYELFIEMMTVSACSLPDGFLPKHIFPGSSGLLTASLLSAPLSRLSSTLIIFWLPVLE